MSEPVLEELSEEECVELLASRLVGRIGVVADGYPVVLPVNYRLVGDSPKVYVALRTRPGNVIDQAGPAVAFEIDDVDPMHGTGWSVLVRGTLHHVTNVPLMSDVLDSHPWLGERDAWLVIAPKAISGRRLRAGAIEWAFHLSGYL